MTPTLTRHLQDVLAAAARLENSASDALAELDAYNRHSLPSRIRAGLKRVLEEMKAVANDNANAVRTAAAIGEGDGRDH